MSGQPTGDPLAELVLSYLDDHEVELRPDDTVREARVNTWAYGLPVGGFDVSAVAAALELVARRLSERLNGRRGTFYCWYDEQAGQLRCSLTSRLADQLPFGGATSYLREEAWALSRSAYCHAAMTARRLAQARHGTWSQGRLNQTTMQDD